MSVSRTAVAVSAVALAAALAGCGAVTDTVDGGGATSAAASAIRTVSGDTLATGTTGTTGTTGPADGETSTTSTAPALVLQDGWAKASPAGMTGAFGTLRNTTDADVVVVSAESPLAARTELHETSGGAMRPARGGFTVPANGRLELRPGGNHLMLMGLTGPMNPGTSVRITLHTSRGTEIPVTVTGRTFAGGGETYQGPTPTGATTAPTPAGTPAPTAGGTATPPLPSATDLPTPTGVPTAGVPTTGGHGG